VNNKIYKGKNLQYSIHYLSPYSQLNKEGGDNGIGDSGEDHKSTTWDIRPCWRKAFSNI